MFKTLLGKEMFPRMKRAKIGQFSYLPLSCNISLEKVYLLEKRWHLKKVSTSSLPKMAHQSWLKCLNFTLCHLRQEWATIEGNKFRRQLTHFILSPVRGAPRLKSEESRWKKRQMSACFWCERQLCSKWWLVKVRQLINFDEPLFLRGM